MLRSEPRLDPAVVEDLDRLDAALQAFAADPDDRSATEDLDAELLALVTDVRASRPELDVGTRMRLEERVLAAKEAPQRRTFAGRMPADRRWRAGLAAAAVVAVAIPVGVVVRGDVGGDAAPLPMSLSDETSALPSSVGRSATTSAGAASATTSGDEAGSSASADAAADRAQTPAEAGSLTETRTTLSGASRAPDAELRKLTPSLSRLQQATRAPLDARRRVVRDVAQTIRVGPGEVARAAERVTTVVQDAGGYLGRSEVRERGTNAGGTFEVVVPTGRLDGTVAALSRIGRPVRLERTSTDVTDQATSLADRLADLRADRAAARLQLAKTVDPARRAARRRELTLLSSRVASLQGQVDGLRRQTATSRIDLRLTTRKAAEDSAVPATDDGSWGIGDAWHDAGRVLEVGGGVVLIGGVVVLPLLALGALGLGVRRRGRARRRENVIDHA